MTTISFVLTVGAYFWWVIFCDEWAGKLRRYLALPPITDDEAEEYERY